MTKINLNCQDNPRDGFVNLDMNFKSDGVTKVDSYDLSSEANGSVDEIVANAGCLELIKRSDAPRMASQWKKKLSQGGTLKLSFIDAKKMCESFVYDRISLVDLESFIVDKKSVHSMFEVAVLLRNAGFKIISQDFSSNDMIGTIHAK